MRINPTRIQVGDELFEASVLNREVIKWTVGNIFVEHVRENLWRTIVVLKAGKTWVEERPLSDVLYMHDTHEKAAEELTKALRGGLDG